MEGVVDATNNEDNPDGFICQLYLKIWSLNYEQGKFHEDKLQNVVKVLMDNQQVIKIKQQ